MPQAKLPLKLPTPSHPLKLLSIDPGGTTGLLLATWTEQRKFQIHLAKDIPWDERFKITEFIRHADIIIIEDFILRSYQGKAQIGSNFPSSQIIGAVDFAVHGLPITIVKQPASNIAMATTIYDEHKEALKGLHHARDAYKHMRYFILSAISRLSS